MEEPVLGKLRAVLHGKGHPNVNRRDKTNFGTVGVEAKLQRPIIVTGIIGCDISSHQGSIRGANHVHYVVSAINIPANLDSLNPRLVSQQRKEV